MMAFWQQLPQLPSDRLAVDGALPLSFEQLLNTATQLRSTHPELHGKALALKYTSTTEFLCALLAFDGWCSALYLLPDSPQELAMPADLMHWPADAAAKAPLSKLRHSTEPTLETVWYLATSGTTGTPKWIPHRFASLCRAVKSNSASALRWGLCYQPYRFAGLQVLLQSVLSGACLIDASSGDAHQRMQIFKRYQINALSATPSLWRQLLMTNQLAELPLQQLTLGGEIADQSLLSILRQLFPTARILHIYASTEAGVGFSVSDGQAGFPEAWLQQTRSGIQMRINAEQHLCIKPATVPVRSQHIVVDADGFIDTGDVVQLQSGRVQFLGRANGAINVGGNKVHPEQVEQVLMQHEAVLQARVYGKASSVLGQLVVADVVTKPGSDHKKLQSQLMQLCLTQLQRYQIPTRYHWVAELANNSSGKLSRKESNV